MKKPWILVVVLFGVVVFAVLTAGQARKPANQAASKNQGPVLVKVGPVITGTNTDCYADHCDIEVNGRDFGATRGTNRFLCDGKEIPTGSWSNKVITFHGWFLTFWPDHHTLAITDATGTFLSNTYDAVFLYRFDGCDPNHGKPGIEITVYTWGAGPQAGKSLWMGTTPMVINDWPAGKPGTYSMKIRAVVPNLPTGPYDITMHSGAAQISSRLPFKID